MGVKKGTMPTNLDLYTLAREHFESSVLLEKPLDPEKERNHLYAGLSALAHAIENHLNEVLKAVRESKT